jgi:hypothetical protein
MVEAPLPSLDLRDSRTVAVTPAACSFGVPSDAVIGSSSESYRVSGPFCLRVSGAVAPSAPATQLCGTVSPANTFGLQFTSVRCAIKRTGLLCAWVKATDDVASGSYLLQARCVFVSRWHQLRRYILAFDHVNRYPLCVYRQARAVAYKKIDCCPTFEGKTRMFSQVKFV